MVIFHSYVSLPEGIRIAVVTQLQKKKLGNSIELVYHYNHHFSQICVVLDTNGSGWMFPGMIPLDPS